jgi:FkbM family methyltransferase
MKFSASLATLVHQKKAEINQRGLMGFPVDSGQDMENQTSLAREIKALTDVAIYQSPTTGLRLPVDSVFPANMLYYFLVGDYEENDMKLIRQYVKPGSRVLELGGGVGLTGSLLGQVSGNAVNVCEPNPALYSYIERTFAANDVKLNLIQAAVTADHEPAEQVSFHICKDYWWSSLVEAENAKCIQVQAKRLSDLIIETEADTLLVDIEGYDVELLSSTEALSSISTVLIELHTPSIGTVATAAIITKLVSAGFALVDMGGHTFVFTRHASAAIQPGPNGRWY